MQLTMRGFLWDPPRVPTYYNFAWVPHTFEGVWPLLTPPLFRTLLTTLEVRRKRGDLIECYIILTGKENVDPLQFFHISDIKYDLRGHSLELVANRSRLNIRQNFFSQRVVRSWNCLPHNVIDAPSVNSFKNRLDKFWKSAVTYLNLCSFLFYYIKGSPTEVHNYTSTSTSNEFAARTIKSAKGSGSMFS